MCVAGGECECVKKAFVVSTDSIDSIDSILRQPLRMYDPHFCMNGVMFLNWNQLQHFTGGNPQSSNNALIAHPHPANDKHMIADDILLSRHYIHFNTVGIFKVRVLILVTTQGYVQLTHQQPTHYMR
jgi:hypothetical protein